MIKQLKVIPRGDTPTLPVRKTVAKTLEISGIKRKIDNPISKPKEFSNLSVLLENHRQFIYYANLMVQSFWAEKIAEAFPDLGVSLSNIDPDKFVVPSIDLVRSGVSKKNWKIDESVPTLDTGFRVAKLDNAIKLSLPIGSETDISTQGLDFAIHAFPEAKKYKYDFNSHRNIYKVFSNLLGKGFFDLSRPVDVTVPAIYLDEHFSVEPYLNSGRLTKEVVEQAKNFIKTIRIVSQPVPKSHLFVVPGTREQCYTLAQLPRKATPEEDARLRVDFGTHVFRYRRLQLFVELEIGSLLIEYATQTEFNRLGVHTVGDWFNQWAGKAMVNSKDWVEAINPITAIHQQNMLVSERAKPITDEDGLAINIDGEILYVPTVDEVTAHDKAVRDEGTTETGEFTRRDLTCILPPFTPIDTTYKKTLPKFPTNQIVYTDWVNAKLVYANSLGKLSVEDLDGYSRATATHFRKFLDQHMFNGELGLAPLNYTMIYSDHLGIKPNEFFDLNECLELDPRISVTNTPSWIISLQNSFNKGRMGDFVVQTRDFVTDHFVRTGTEGLSEEQQSLIEEFFEDSPSSSLAWTLRLISPDSPIYPLRAVYRFIKKLSDTAMADAQKNVTAGGGVLTGMYALGCLKVIEKYAPVYQDIKQEDVAQRKEYKSYKQRKFDPSYVPRPTPLMTGKLLPHQARVDSVLGEKPKIAVLAIDAGGGKTRVALKDALNLLHDNEIKRPLIVCPKHLIKNYVSDAQEMTGGKLNVIVISTDTINTYGLERLERMVKAAPINTVVVADINIIGGNPSSRKKVAYGTSQISISEVTEMLRDCDFDYLVLDESQKVKNPQSARTKNLQRFVQDIPYRRIATGTFIHNQATDIIGQMSILDPSIFGSRRVFDRDFVESQSRAGHVTKWKPDKATADRIIRRRLDEYCCFVQVKRKEWAYLLPEKVEQFRKVSLTEVQRVGYNMLVKKTLEQLAKDDPEAFRKFQEGELGSEDDLDSNEAEDDNEGGSRRSLAKIIEMVYLKAEKFLANPLLFEKELEGYGVTLGQKDKVGPKVNAAIEIMREHLSDKTPGKVLVVSKYEETAACLMDNLPADLKAITMRYKAERKEEHVNRFNTHDHVQFMVGIRDSLEEGLNLQCGTRVLALETPWTPGANEQLEARIYRPQPGKVEERTQVFIDWLCADGTVDCCKIARLIYKAVSNAQVEEQGNPYFKDMQTIDLNSVSMSPDSIKNLDNWDTLKEYMDAFKLYRQCIHTDTQEYLRRHPERDMIAVPAADLPGSKLIDTTYVPEMKLPFMSELGIMRVSDYLLQQSQSISAKDAVGQRVACKEGSGLAIGFKGNAVDIQLDELDGNGDPRTITTSEFYAEQILTASNFNMKNMRVHTEFGDGTVIKSYADKIHVKLDDGQTVVVTKQCAFILTKKSSQSVKERLAQLVGLGARRKTITPDMVEEKPVEETVEKPLPMEDKHTPIPNNDFVKNNNINFYVAVINNAPCLAVDDEDPDAESSLMQSLGFVHSGPYYYSEIDNIVVVRNLLRALIDNFKVPKPIVNQWNELGKALKQGQIREDGPMNIEAASRVEIRQFLTTKERPSPDGFIAPYPVIQDGKLWICVDKKSASALELTKVTKKYDFRIKWFTEPGGWYAYYSTKPALVDAIKQLVRKYPVSDENKERLKDSLRNLKLN